MIENYTLLGENIPLFDFTLDLDNGHFHMQCDEAENIPATFPRELCAQCILCNEKNITECPVANILDPLIYFFSIKHSYQELTLFQANQTNNVTTVYTADSQKILSYLILKLLLFGIPGFYTDFRIHRHCFSPFSDPEDLFVKLVSTKLSTLVADKRLDAEAALSQVRNDMRVTFKQLQLLLGKMKKVIYNDALLNAVCNLITIFNFYDDEWDTCIAYLGNQEKHMW